MRLERGLSVQGSAMRNPGKILQAGKTRACQTIRAKLGHIPKSDISVLSDVFRPSLPEDLRRMYLGILGIDSKNDVSLRRCILKIYS